MEIHVRALGYHAKKSFFYGTQMYLNKISMQIHNKKKKCLGP